MEAILLFIGVVLFFIGNKMNTNYERSNESGEEKERPIFQQPAAYFLYTVGIMIITAVIALMLSL